MGEMGCGLTVGLQSQEAGKLQCGVSLSIVLVCVVYSRAGVGEHSYACLWRVSVDPVPLLHDFSLFS